MCRTVETCRSSSDVVKMQTVYFQNWFLSFCLFPRPCKLGLHRYSFVVISEIWSETLGSCVAMKTTWYVCGDCRSQLSAGKLDLGFLRAGVSPDCHPGLNYNQPFCGLPRTFQFISPINSSGEFLRSLLSDDGLWGSRAAGWPGLYADLSCNLKGHGIVCEAFGPKCPWAGR